MKIFNTYSRKLEEFKPLNKGVVTFYSCGPTVYDYAHIGNLKKYVNDDIIARTFEFNGYKVKHVTNITDVGHLVGDADDGEDKMVKALKREKLDFTSESMLKLAGMYTEAFMKDLKALNIETPDVMPKATDHVKEMIEIVQGLIDKGYVYETSTAFYFDTSKFKNYGKLGNLREDDQQAGARVEVDPEKKNPFDFAVWMKAVGKNEQHVMNWPAPFYPGKGFPGWHIECSAMAMKHLGQTIDIHSGGIDHIQVHHTNELAQSEAYTDKPFVKYWVHNEFLVLDKGKMSKSAGTFIRLQDLIDKGYDPLAYRYLLLQAHYRSPINFSFESLDDAQNGVNNLREKVLALGGDTNARINQEYVERFKELLNNDFDTPRALTVVFEVLKDKELSNEEKKGTILKMDEVLGLGLGDLKVEEIEVPTRMHELAQARLEAKSNKDYQKADELRLEIEAEGWVVEDGKDGEYKLRKG